MLLLHLEQICLRSYVRNKFGYSVVTACITTPDLYCCTSRKPITWTQKAPMHRRTVKKIKKYFEHDISPLYQGHIFTLFDV